MLQSKLERLWSLPAFKDIAMRTDLLDSNYLHKDGVLRVRCQSRRLANTHSCSFKKPKKEVFGTKRIFDLLWGMPGSR